MAFAGNSILCRLALGEESIDAASFTVVRMLSAVVFLAVILKVSSTDTHHSSKGSWKASLVLFLYAITFSYAYISLETGIGALILFASVQITMVLTSLLSGKRLHQFEWLGLMVAFGGFVYLVLPSLSTPSFVGFILMTVAGICWGFYTLAGRGAGNPLSDTAYNFFRTLPLVGILFAVTVQYGELSQKGILLAVLAGGLTSGVGYTIWYTALKGLSATQAAVIQLMVPVIAAVGGVIFSNELFTLRLGIATLLILGGILTVVLAKHFTTVDRNVTTAEKSIQ